MDAAAETAFEGQWVRIMSDHSADGVWDRAGCACDADDLPVTPELRSRIRLWQEDYEGSLPPPGRVEWDAARWETFSSEGRLIAAEVKRQLPDWAVVYFDEARAKEIADWEPNRRALFEYEIALEPIEAGPTPTA